MKQFIKLHNTDDNTLIIISAQNIDLIDTEWVDERNRYVSHVYTKSENVTDFYVNETPEKIFQMLNE